ncbi:MAG: Asp-tRNA(Asn)/Glu-tRNA(Gln) amidotransferase subunit GatC [Candidatus Aenigmarchaeota archaeon]|nr:Asp-tRNA(Asn)/Glu-tRNA(Gln) amidotransferase subunit GatC [Candidatus Aenigmarchaeota archaeon]
MDKEMMEKVAKLARLNLTESEMKKFSKDLEEILKAFKSLDKVKTDSVKPTIQPIEMENITRDDKIEDSLSQEEALSNVKLNKEKGYFKGPRVVD